jgi:hypothetical protein
MITILNSQLTNDAIAALNNLIEMNIKAGVAFKLMRIIKEISSLVEDKLAMEKKILEKWVEKDADGKAVPVYDNGAIVEGAVRISNMDSFQAEMTSLLNAETVLQHAKINFDDLGLEMMKIKDLLKIDFIFE